MQNNTGFRWCSKYLILKFFFVTILLQYCLSIQLYDGEKGLLPLSRLERAKIFTGLDENLAGGLLAYPRLGRRLWDQTKTLIPYPRAGRLVIDPEDYGIFLNIGYAAPESEESLADVLQSNPPVQKRAQMKLIPRIGRKKRSVSRDQNVNNKHPEEDKKEVLEPISDNSAFNSPDDSEADYFYATDKRGTLSKSAFAPRIGKKRSDYLEEYLEGKRRAAFTPRIGRAAMFTPRIGRAALIPRIGRTDPRFRLRSRSSFIPRIGRRAALIPRIGRSENS